MYHIILLVILVSILLLTCLKYHFTECFENEQSQIYPYVINLDRNRERYEKFLEKYNQYMKNTTIQRIAATDGSKLSYELLEQTVAPEVFEGIKNIDKTGKRQNDIQLTKGMIGCYISHLFLYKTALEKKHNIVLVFEDDAFVDRDLMKFLQELKEYPSDWDILLLGYVRIFKENLHSDSWTRVYDFWGTQGYLINKKGMEKMLKKSYPIKNQIDHMMGDFARQGLLNIYGYKNNLVKQNSIYSDVQMPISK